MENASQSPDKILPANEPICIWDEEKLNAKPVKKITLYSITKKLIFWLYDFYLLPAGIYKTALFIFLLIICKPKVKAAAAFAAFSIHEFTVRLNVVFSFVVWFYTINTIIQWII